MLSCEKKWRWGKFTHSAWGRFTQCANLPHRHFFVIIGTSDTCITNSFPTPEDVRPFQKAGPRKRSNRGGEKKANIVPYRYTCKKCFTNREREINQEEIRISPSYYVSVSELY
ncbi:hypothetical protein AVEN_137446-1 [Araneus ventricosus]|uniref:Uncharacterized protein n=1 Tax=Araneus ventricosus TaxID=182803 RepID=A0A4Y2JXJ1_ARAVE|nr:hypothetical protein AVEN_137446-1 [Araneus ventricosus]